MTGSIDTDSSPELKERVARFMSRSAEILEHPLAGTISDVAITFKVSTPAARIVGADFDTNPQDKSSWGYLATLLRPLIFLTSDEGSVGGLMNMIKKEHPRLRGHGLEKIQRAINDWRKQPIIAVQDLGPIVDPPAVGNVGQAWIGDVGTDPDDFDVSAMTPDFELADVYFNGRMWHADADKVDRWEGASPGMRGLMIKCAEVRTLSGVQWIRSLRDWIIDARGAGWPL